jgi:hypothetical protein
MSVALFLTRKSRLYFRLAKWLFSSATSNAILNAEVKENSVTTGLTATFRRGDYRFAVLLAFAFAALICLPMFFRGFPSGIDSDRHYRWVMQFSEALKEPGVWYPRWLGTANNRLGSPMPLYYPPLSFYVASLFQLFTGDAQKSLILSCFFALALSGVTMYIFARSRLSPRWSLLAAGVYMIAPYHLLDLYHGSSVPEFWAFVWLPLVLDAVSRIASGRGIRAVLYLSLSYALLLFTHVPISFGLTLLLPIYALILTRRWKPLAQIAAGLALGSCLTAIFLLPVAMERDAVRINALLHYQYDNFFVLKNTKRATKTPLFLHDLEYYEKYADTLKPGDYRFLIKVEQAVLGIPVLLLISAVLLIINRRRLAENRPLLILSLATFIVTLASLFMATKRSLALWHLIPQLPFLQFPWRWMVITTTGLALLTAASSAMVVKASKLRWLQVSLLVAALLVNVVISAFLIIRAPFYDDDFDLDRQRREAPEYRPQWWNNKLHEEEELPPVVVVSGDAEPHAIDDLGAHQRYEVNAHSDAVLTFRTLYFPGWVARVDEQKVDIAPGNEGYIQLNVAPGEHHVTLDFGDTPPRLVGKIISALALLVLLAVAFFLWRKAQIDDKTLSQA